MRYFVAGNLWLMMALVLFLGRDVARTQPTMYSFFGAGGWHHPTTYNLFIIISAGLGLLLVALDLMRNPMMREPGQGPR